MILKLTSKEHEELSHLWSYADGGAEEMEGGRVLLHGEVHETQVVEDLPVEGTQVVRALQAADRLQEMKRD